MSSLTSDVGRRIVCAAMESNNGEIVLGIRHFDSIMRQQVDDRNNAWFTRQVWKQGFIDNEGSFLTRREAWPVAEAAGQIIRRCGGDDAQGGILYSENLY